MDGDTVWTSETVLDAFEGIDYANYMWRSEKNKKYRGNSTLGVLNQDAGGGQDGLPLRRRVRRIDPPQLRLDLQMTLRPVWIFRSPAVQPPRPTGRAQFQRGVQTPRERRIKFGGQSAHDGVSVVQTLSTEIRTG